MGILFMDGFDHPNGWGEWPHHSIHNRLTTQQTLLLCELTQTPVTAADPVKVPYSGLRERCQNLEAMVVVFDDEYRSLQEDRDNLARLLQQYQQKYPDGV